MWRISISDNRVPTYEQACIWLKTKEVKGMSEKIRKKHEKEGKEKKVNGGKRRNLHNFNWGWW